MNHRAVAVFAFALIGCGLALSGCGAEGVGSIGPPPGTTRKDDSYLIPGYDPSAAKTVKKRGKAASTKIQAVPVDLKNQRH